MKKFVIGLLVITISGCSSFNFINKEETIFAPEKYKTNIILYKSKLSENEKTEKLKNWWGQFDDPVLIEIINKSQENSPNIASAIINIKNYELMLETNKRKAIPSFSFNANLERSGSKGYDNSNSLSIGFKSSWELDLFGKNELLKKSNEKQVENAKAMWHDAKTIVAAETARTYFNYHFCKKSLDVLEEDYLSKKSQNEIIKLKVNAGFEAKSSLYQTEAGLAQSEANILSNNAQCTGYIKSLVAISAIDEYKINELLSMGIKSPHKLKLFVPVTIPGELIYQRPDIFSSMNNINIASLGFERIKLDYLPEVSLSGNISNSLTTINGFNTNGNDWSVGPLTVRLPIFNGEIKRSNEELFKLQYNQAKLKFYSDLRIAIKEVEIAMINLNSQNEKLSLLEKSVDNYKKSYQATKQKYDVGLSSLFELEDSRRQLLSEINGQINNELDKINSWIDLYKAVGGGFKVMEKKNEIK